MIESIRISDGVTNKVTHLMKGDAKGSFVQSGFSKFDDYIGGLDPGSLVTIGGRTAMGKTAFAINLAKNVSSQGNPVLYINLETTKEQFIDKLLSCATGIELRKIRLSTFLENDWKNLEEEMGKLQELPIYVDNRATAKIDELCDDIAHSVNEKSIKLVIIDYLQLLYTTVSAPSDNRYGDLNYYTRRLKSLAKELNVPIILLSQLNRNIEREGRGLSIEEYRPRFTDLRDSGTICDDSDMVLFLYRPEYYHFYEDEKGKDMRGKAELIVAKNRFGDTATFTLRCNLDTVSFIEYDP